MQNPAACNGCAAPTGNAGKFRRDRAASAGYVGVRAKPMREQGSCEEPVLGLFVVLTAIAYVTLLFAIASLGDRRAARQGVGQPRPYIYALSLAIYCTSWTFFGSVGLAAERNLEFLAIYVGPVLVFLFGYPLLARIVRLAKGERITSIADFLGARYGKSFAVASIATLIAVIGAVPYIALQLKAISSSVSLMVEHCTGAPLSFDPFVSDISLVVALLLALFAVLFGTRHADATEHQDGLVLAVAVESIVKLAAFLTVGLAVTFILFDGPAGMVARMAATPAVDQAMSYKTSLGTWLVLTGLSAFAIIMLPRQFYVMIVENRNESELRTASWLFPSIWWRSTSSSCRSPSPAWRWSAPPPAATSTSCPFRCSAATTCWP